MPICLVPGFNPKLSPNLARRSDIYIPRSAYTFFTSMLIVCPIVSLACAASNPGIIREKDPWNVLKFLDTSPVSRGEPQSSPLRSRRDSTIELENLYFVGYTALPTDICSYCVTRLSGQSIWSTVRLWVWWGRVRIPASSGKMARWDFYF